MTDNELYEKAQQFAELKIQELSYKKESDKLKDELKDEMIAQNLNALTVAGYEVRLGKRVSPYFDEALLIQILKGTNSEAVKTVEVVDMDILENEIYNGVIPASEIAVARHEKTTYSLSAKRSKK